MRILEVNKFYYARRGAERHMLDVIEVLQVAGHETRVFSMNHPLNLEITDQKFFPSHVAYNDGEGSLYERLIGIGRLFYSFEAKRKMGDLLAEWKPDIAHLHNIYHQLSPSILAPLKEKGIPIVMTVHDYNLISPDKDTYYPEVGQAYYKFLSIRKYSFSKRILLVLKKYFEDAMGFYQAVDMFIVPSEYVKNVLVGAGFSVEKMRV
jgi:glycosyltransferase involved in cell wall biosynthesis